MSLKARLFTDLVATKLNARRMTALETISHIRKLRKLQGLDSRIEVPDREMRKKRRWKLDECTAVGAYTLSEAKAMMSKIIGRKVKSNEMIEF